MVVLLLVAPILAAPPSTIRGEAQRRIVASEGGFVTYYVNLSKYGEARGLVDSYGPFYTDGLTSFSKLSAPQFSSANLTDYRRFISNGSASGWFEYANNGLRASAGFGFSSPASLSVYSGCILSPNSLSAGLDAAGAGRFVAGAVWYFSEESPLDVYYEKYSLNGNFAASLSWNFTTPPTALPTPTGRPATISLWPRS